MENNKFKSNKEYGTKFRIEEERDYVKGHNLFSFHEGDTEVEVLKEIINQYIDTSSIQGVVDFADHKIDFSLSVIDTMVLSLTEKLMKARLHYADIEKQLMDVNHRIIQPYLYGTTIGPEEKMKIYDIQENLLITRRDAKDAISIIEVLIDNFTKSRNFILAMNKRQYSPKSSKFQDDDNFRISNEFDRMDKELQPTRVDVSSK